jgi:hypothetical protein
MFSSDPKSPMVRAVAVLAGLAVFGFGYRAIVGSGQLHYTNWFGELVFAPIAILLGLITIFGALFKPELLGRPRARPKHRRNR